MKVHTIWSGRMRLSNVKEYLAEALNVPVAGMELKLYWPHKGTLNEISEDEMNKSTLTELRDVWNEYR
jgi:hypothetical protein